MAIEGTDSFPGIRSEAELESAVMRPQIGYYDDIFHEAAALFESLVTNHAFRDGNKRTTILSTIVFLGLNKYVFSCDADTAFCFIRDIIDNKKDRVRRIREWLEKWTSEQ